MRHIKKFNEEIFLRGEDSDKGHDHISSEITDGGITNQKMKPSKEYLDFLDKFTSNLVEIKDKVDSNGYLDRYDMNWLEELYSLHKTNF